MKGLYCMLNLKNYLCLSLLCVSLACMPNGSKSGSQKPIGKANVSGEAGIRYITSDQNKEILEAKLQEMYDAIKLLNEVLINNENKNSYLYHRISQAEKSEIARQRDIFLEAIELTNNMYLGEIPVDISRIKDQLQQLIRK